MSVLRPAADVSWVERAVAALDSLAVVPTEVLEARVRSWGACLPGPVIGEPPELPIEEPCPDRGLAARLCAGCPVRAECLEIELRDAGEFTTGVWGGLGEDDRRVLLAPWRDHPDRGAYATYNDEREGDDR